MNNIWYPLPGAVNKTLSTPTETKWRLKASLVVKALCYQLPKHYLYRIKYNQCP
jgi:hypothetical protein